jgi:DNA-binding SARP family transcriptional activator
MYKILLIFRVAFGHTGVPPTWVGDPEFADWVSRQRQLYREVLKTGHRTASSIEHSRLRKLQNLDFVWEYDEWHWDKCYKDIQKRMQEYSAKYNNDANGGGGEVLDPMMPLPPSLQFWLNIQREVAQQNHDQLSDMKRKKLQSLIGSGWDEETEFEEEFLLI